MVVKFVQDLQRLDGIVVVFMMMVYKFSLERERALSVFGFGAFNSNDVNKEQSRNTNGSIVVELSNIVCKVACGSFSQFLKQYCFRVDIEDGRVSDDNSKYPSNVCVGRMVCVLFTSTVVICSLIV